MDKDFENAIQELKLQLLPSDIWDNIPSGDFHLNVGHDEKFDFEIRPREQCHYKGHFHVKAGEFSGSYLIVPVQKRDGNFSSKDNKIIINWGIEHQDMLISKWNSLHPDKELIING